LPTASSETIPTQPGHMAKTHILLQLHGLLTTDNCYSAAYISIGDENGELINTSCFILYYPLKQCAKSYH